MKDFVLYPSRLFCFRFPNFSSKQKKDGKTADGGHDVLCKWKICHGASLEMEYPSKSPVCKFIEQ
eukprot:scaffold5580_cov61-Cyclotella_meneghiniana.AAC.4